MTQDFSHLHFNYLDACAGSGKTAAALKAIHHGTLQGRRYVLAQPTMDLIDATRQRAEAVYADIQWRAITSRDHPGETHSEFIKAIKSPALTAEVLIVTHATLLSCWQIIGKGNWMLVIDEIPGVDEFFKANLSLTWKIWTEHLEVSNNPSSDKILDVAIKNGSLAAAKTFATNAPSDEVIMVTQPLWKLLVNPAYTVNLHRSAYQTAGFNGIAQLQAHALLLPVVLEGWQRVTIMGANFKNSLLHMIWSNLGVTFEEDRYIKVAKGAHDKKAGGRCRIQYLTERIWSKELRNRIGIARITRALAAHIVNPHIWTANKDVPDSDWFIAGGTRLPAVSHGLNDFRGYDTAVFLAALNDMTSHFAWLEKVHGIDPLEVSRAKSLEAAYQMALRTNLREQGGTSEISIIVADRRTADYLCSLLPGAKLNFLDLGISELGNSLRDKPTKAPAKTPAERKRIDRDRKANRRAALEDLQTMLLQSKGHLNPVITVEDSVFGAQVAAIEYQNWDKLKRDLYALWQNTVKDKHENMLMSGGVFSQKDTSLTIKGKDAFDYAQMIQLDFDDSEIDPSELKSLLHDIKHFSYNSYSNGKGGRLRYRTVIPLALPVDVDVYQLLWDMIADRLREAGYDVSSCSYTTGPSSGLDRTKRTPVSFFYLPAQAAQKTASFWVENWDANLLDPNKWIERAPQHDVDYVNVAPIGNAGAKLQKLREAIAAGNIDVTSRKAEKVSLAISEWRSTAAGQGNNGFYRFGCALRNAGCDRAELENHLHREHDMSHSDARARRRQIPSILKSLYP